MSLLTGVSPSILKQILLGWVHIGFTFFNYHGLSYEAIWSLGTGVVIVLAGFINIAMLRDAGRDAVIWTLTLVTNLFFLLGFAAASYMMREPQVFIGTLPFEHVKTILAQNTYGHAKVAAPEMVGDTKIMHVWDPCGVLPIFVQ